MKRKSDWPEVQQRRVKTVQAGEGYVIRVAWVEGGESVIDLTPWIAGRASLAPLLDTTLFATVAVGENGSTVAWDGERFEIDALHLAFLELEQDGLPVTPDAFRRWRQRAGLTQAQAARALGVNPRMYQHYEAGTSFIPRTVALACKGFDALRREAA